MTKKQRRPVLLVSGDHEFFVARCVNEVRKQAHAQGAEVDEIGPEELSAAITTPAFMV